MNSDQKDLHFKITTTWYCFTYTGPNGSSAYVLPDETADWNSDEECRCRKGKNLWTFTL